MALKVGGNARVEGVPDVLRALRLCNASVQQRVRNDVETTTKEIAADAKRRVALSSPKSRKAKNRPGPGELRDTIRAEMYGTDAPVGFVKAGNGKLPRRSRATKPKKLGPLTRKQFEREQVRLAKRQQRELGMYAMVQEFGSPKRGQPARPYLRPSMDAARPRHIDRLRKSLASAVRQAGG